MSHANDPKIEMRRISSLKPWATNARTHSKHQIQQIADSIELFGFTNPVLIDESDNILAGHGRVLAATRLGHDEVPCVQLAHMSSDQKRAYVLADNKLALNAGWDEEILAGELAYLSELDLDFSIDLTGFSLPEVDLIIQSARPEDEGNPEDDILPDDEDLRDVQPGDVFQLGPHLVICGDARDPEVLAALMDGDKATMVFTDPPYNVPIDGHVCGSGAIKHREFAMASGEMNEAEFTQFLQDSFQQLAAHTVDGSIHFICMDWRHITEIMSAGLNVYSELKNLITWVKDNGGMGTFYRSRHELIFAFKNGTNAHINNFQLGQHGRYRTNVWQYRGVNSPGADRLEALRLHPTVKPVPMIADAILDVSGRGDIVLDTFGGSGSTLIAAHKTGRHARLVEYDPIYVARIIKRYEAYAHDKAVQIACGLQPRETRNGSSGAFLDAAE